MLRAGARAAFRGAGGGPWPRELVAREVRGQPARSGATVGSIRRRLLSTQYGALEALRAYCYNQRKLGKPQILCFGALLITSSQGFSIAFEGSYRKTYGSKGV